jgi:hypothetical protein
MRPPDRPLALGGRRQLALLAFLLVHGRRGVSLDALVDAVWSGRFAPRCGSGGVPGARLTDPQLLDRVLDGRE